MIKIEFPSQEDIVIKSIVFDFNGTLAINGQVENDTIKSLNNLVEQYGVQVYVLTADTYGTVTQQFLNTKIQVKIVSKQNGTVDKVSFVKDLGAKYCAAVGNGYNDTEMLKAARLGICIMGEEGCSTQSLVASDIVVTNIIDAITLFNYPLRIKATLRK